jgi:anti-sigma factor RsiW
MTHPDEGTLQAFLDDELSTAERAKLAEHLLVCDVCRGTHEELLRANALFSRAISLTDVEVAPSGVRVRSRAPAGASAFVKAAILVLALAATAAATVPGSPVRQWIVETVTREHASSEVADSGVVPPPTEAETPAPVPAGIRIPVTAPVMVSLSDLDGTEIRLVEPSGDQVAVSMTGADRDPVFRTEPGRVVVSGGSGGELQVTFPVHGHVRLEVDGRLYAESEDGVVVAHVSAEASGTSLIWR